VFWISEIWAARSGWTAGSEALELLITMQKSLSPFVDVAVTFVVVLKRGGGIVE